MDDECWRAALESTHKAVRDYARTEFKALNRRVIYGMQRVSASGIFGDGYIYKTLWDEYCHGVQDGPHDVVLFIHSVSNSFDTTVGDFVDDAIERLPHHVAVLLSIFAAWEIAGDSEDLVGFWPEGIRRVLLKLLDEKAGMRSLDHLGPWRNG